MSLVPTSVRAILALVVLACFPIAAKAQDGVRPGEDVMVGSPAVAEPAPGAAALSHAANAATPPALRGRVGAAFGFMRFGGTVKFDYTNSPTPFAGASGPYTGAVIETEHVGPGFILSGGYRGPFRAGSRAGFGIEGEWGGGGGHPADKQVTGTSPTGAKVTFSTERGGIIDLIIVGGSGHVSYNVARSVNVMGGLKVASLRVKPGFGSYVGPASKPGLTNYLASSGDRSPRIWRTAVSPWVGAEVFVGNHGSVDISASFEPGTTQHLADAPWVLTFHRSQAWLVVAIRIFR